MRKLMRLTVIACAAVSLLAVTAGTASADRGIEIAPGGPIAAEGPLRIFTPIGGAIITCQLRLNGNFVRIVQKVAAGTLPEGRIGQLRAFAATECLDNFGREWVVTFLVEPRRPAMMRYDAFLGFLPAIEGILITTLNVGIRLVSGPTNCLFQGNIPFLLFRSAEEGRFNRKKLLENRLNYVEGLPCPVESAIFLEGTFVVEPPQTLNLL